MTRLAIPPLRRPAGHAIVLTAIALLCLLGACNFPNARRTRNLQHQANALVHQTKTALQNNDMEAVEPLADSLLHIAETLKDTAYLIRAQMLQAEIAIAQGQPLQAIERLTRIKNTYSRHLPPAKTAAINLRLGTLQRLVGNHVEAVYNTRKAYNYATDTQDSTLLALCLTELGLDYLNIQSYAKALEHFRHARSVIPAQECSERAMRLRLGLGALYLQNNNLNIAKMHLTQALQIATSIRHQPGRIEALLTLAQTHLKQHHIDSAQECIQRAKDLINAEQDPFSQLLYFKTSADLYRAKRQYAISRGYHQKALEVARFLNNSSQQTIILTSLAGLERQTGHPDSAFLFARRAVQMRDSLHELQIQRRFVNADLEAKHIQEQEAYESQKQIQSQRLINSKRRALIFQIILLGTLAWLLFTLYLTQTTYRARKRTNERLLEEERTITERNHQLESITAQINQLRTESLKQSRSLDLSRQHIIEHGTLLIKSIEYANTLQRSIRTADDRVARYFPQHFLLSRPRDLVNTDLPWFAHINGISILAMVDCLGHSIAGASLTFIAYMQLNRIVIEKKIVAPNEIINQFYQETDLFLASAEEDFKRHVDMTIAILTIDPERNQAHFAANNQPLFYTNDGRSIKRIRGPLIRFADLNTPYVEPKVTTIPLTPQTAFYLTTDGYINQMNAEQQKIGTERFLQLLKENAAQPLSQQHDELIQYLARFKLGAMQLDDITIFAVSLAKAAQGPSGA